jgi:Tfp pilus assembly protein PilF
LSGFEKASDARFATTYSLWGYSLHYKQRDTEALAKYDIALKLDPKSLAAHLGKAQVVAQMGDLESAEQQFRAAADIASERQFIDIYREWGDTLRGHGSYKRAEVVYRSIIRRIAKEFPEQGTSDDTIAIYYGLSDALAHQDKKKEADGMAAVAAELKNRQFDEQLFR